VTGYCEQICCIKKQTCNSCLNSYSNSKKVIKNNYRSYYKVVTKLLQWPNKQSNGEIAEFSNKKKEQYGKIFKM
jgi:hypothetical protein